nr:hypothetical protein [Candidatus Sigynarchaeota archaeon]
MELPPVREVAPGIILAMAEDQICGSWMLVNGKSCFVVETPPKADDGDTVPADLVGNYLKDHDLTPVGLTETHHHWDHTQGVDRYWDMLADYPTFPWICHKSFLDAAKNYTLYFDTIFREEIYETSIGGEPLYLIHAPKHCVSDVMIVYRGTMITGDWWLGTGDPNWNHVPPEVSIASVDRILNFLQGKHYDVHRLFSVHANDFRYGVNTTNVLLETRHYHESKLGR